jgi:hypothetical protein
MGTIELGEIAEGGAHTGVLGTERLFKYREGELQQRLGLGVAALSLEYISQSTDGRGIFGVVIAMSLASQGNVSLGYRCRFCVLAPAIEVPDLGAQESKVIGDLCWRLRWTITRSKP